ncbi:FecR domain-containing protein [Paracoccus sp. DMF]|uniref:FecR domain-containing protein n=1 Tax=Paracoccus sp. DMF TaxID=400837 RepID=UPI0021E4D4CA|nr:FecR domain-containing protein [Paracoccus sp. DMF]MCV2447719.1 FecR domain-containing protein [Paracoccus sp. DMF]
MPPQPPTELLEQAADWALALRYGDADPAQRAAFRDWLAQEPQHAAAWQRAEMVFHSFERLPPGLGRQVLGQVDPQPGRRRALVLLAGLAATGAGALAWQQPWQKWRADVATAVGERRRLALPDASALVLNTDSAADIAFTAAERRIELRGGEILVTTSPDPAPVARPLLIGTAFGEVRALGTRFSLRELDGQVRVAVFRDAVEIRPSRGTPRRIEAGAQAEFSAEGVWPARPVDDSAAIWEQGMLLAQDMPLAEVLAEMARHRHGILRCDRQVAEIRVSGAISLADTEGALDLLARTLPVRIQRRTPWWVVVVPRG